MTDMTDPALESLGWTPGLAVAFAEHRSAGRWPARVVSEERGQFLLHDGATIRPATVAGRLRHVSAGDPLAYPTVGDWVAAIEDAGPGSTVVHALLPRRSAIVRRAPSDHGRAAQAIAANVDVVFIVSSLNAELNSRRLGAVGLDRRAGFRVHRRWQLWRKDLPGGAARVT